MKCVDLTSCALNDKQGT